MENSDKIKVREEIHKGSFSIRIHKNFAEFGLVFSVLLLIVSGILNCFFDVSWLAKICWVVMNGSAILLVIQYRKNIDPISFLIWVFVHLSCLILPVIPALGLDLKWVFIISAVLMIGPILYVIHNRKEFGSLRETIRSFKEAQKEESPKESYWKILKDLESGKWSLRRQRMVALLKKLKCGSCGHRNKRRWKICAGCAVPRK